MATDTRTTGAQTRAPENRKIEELQSLAGTVQTLAEYVGGLSEVVGEQLSSIRALMRDPDTRGINFADVGDWRLPELMLLLIRHESDQLAKIGERLECGQDQLAGAR